MIWWFEKILALLSLSPYIPAASASPFHIRFNFSKEKRSENKKNCVNNLQEKKEAIGEIDRHRLTDIICILTISKIKLVEVVLPNLHLRYSDYEIVLPFDELLGGLPRQRTMKLVDYWVPANSYNTVT